MIIKKIKIKILKLKIASGKSLLGEKINTIFEILENKLEKFTKEQQAYIGAFIVSSASMPVFLLIILFNIKSVAILNTMSAFSAGALVGDVFFHNLPEIFDGKQEKDSENGFFQKKETFLGLGLISLFVIEKVIKLLCNTVSDKSVQSKNKFLII